jgi:hypothetical protein
MVWEFPAISQSQIEFWEKPQYTRKGLLLFTFLFGAFGLHHLYLRSPQTFVMFLIGNFVSLGYWYWFDLIQIYKTCPENLNKYGITTPLKHMAIARGMFKCGDNGGEDKEDEEDENAPPSPLWFMLSALLTSVPFLSNVASGDYSYAFGTLFASLIPILGLFLMAFVIGFSVLEYLVKPADIAVYGTSRIFPFTSLFYDKNGHSTRLMVPEEKEGEPPCKSSGGMLGTILNFLASFFQAAVVFALPVLQFIVPPPILATITNAAAAAKAASNTAVKVVDLAETKVIPMTKEALDRGLAVAEKGADAAIKVGKLAEEVPKSMVETFKSLPIPLQKGGGIGLPQPLPVQPQAPLADSKTPGDWLAIGIIGAVTAGGFLLTAGRSFKDAVQHFQSPGDIPPKNT